MAKSYSEGVSTVWAAYPKAKGKKPGNKSEFAAKWAAYGLTDEDAESMLQKLQETPPKDGQSAVSWLTQTMGKAAPKQTGVKKTEPAAKTHQDQEQPKHPGGRPRKTGQVRVTLSVTEPTIKTLRVFASLQNATMSEIVDQWAEQARRERPEIDRLI